MGVMAAMRACGGLWFGWNGETVPHDPGQPEVVIRGGIAFCTIPLRIGFFGTLHQHNPFRMGKRRRNMQTDSNRRYRRVAYTALVGIMQHNAVATANKTLVGE